MKLSIMIILYNIFKYNILDQKHFFYILFIIIWYDFQNNIFYEESMSTDCEMIGVSWVQTCQNWNLFI